MIARILPDLAPFRESRSFTLLWVGQAVSLTGTQLRLVALPYQVYLMTGSSLHVGLIGLFQAVPLIAFMLFGGVLADSVDRRKLLIVTQACLAVTSGFLALITQAGFVTLPLLYGLTAVTAAISALDIPARGALGPTLVDKKHIGAFVVLNSALHQTGIVVGPALAGLILAAYGVSAAYWIDAATFVVALVLAIGIVAPRRAAVARVPVFRSLLDGFREVRGHAILLPALLIDFAAMFLAWPLAMFPFYGDQVFAMGPQGIGLLYSVPGVGALLAIATAGWVPRVRRQGAGLLFAIAGWGIGLAAFGLMTQSFALALVLLAFAFGADAVSAVFRSTIVQTAVRDEVRGRVGSMNTLFALGGPQLGAARSGVVAAVFSPQVAVVSGGISVIGAAALMWVLAPAFRRYSAAAPEGGATPATAPE